MKPKPFCFVLMPFDRQFDDIYKFGIKGACEDAGAYCERVDEQIFLKERILDRIYNQIDKADIIIADMSHKNPNVFYEVGYAHALGKTTILLTQTSDDIPFDLKHYPHIIYEKQIAVLKTELTKKVKWIVDNPEEKPQDSLAIEIYNKSKNLSATNHPIKIQYTSPFKARLPVNLTFQNNSTKTFEVGEFQVGIIVPESFKYITTGEGEIINNVKVFRLPEGNKICILPYFTTLFPSGYNAYSGVLVFEPPVTDVTIIVRIFSKAGTRDYMLPVVFEEIKSK